MIPSLAKKEHLAKDTECHHCHKTGHKKRNCPLYLAELKKNKASVSGTSGNFTIELFSFPKSNTEIYDTGCGTHICNTIQRFRGYRKLNKGALDLYVGNGHSAAVEHCHLGHINKKCIEKLQHDGLLESIDEESFNVCVSCISGKMARKPFTHASERASDLLEIIHSDVCRPFKTTSREGANYYVTFTDDFSRYGYVYLIKHTHEVFEMFKNFQNEVENQLRKTIKALRSDRGGKYLSQKFLDHLRSREIISQLTPPYKPQHNGGYALESAARILNMVQTKKVNKTPYKMWHKKVPNLSYLKVWDCEVLVKRDTPNKLKSRSIKCIFVGYPKETMGYYFYYPLENKICVARYAEFFETNLIKQESSGSTIDFDEIQSEDAQPSGTLSSTNMRISQAPERYGFYIDAEEHELGDHGEPPNYRAALSDPESKKWLEAMNTKMQSMKDNLVWNLVDLPPNYMTVGSKWLFKKKTDIDGNIHTYEARLVAKGFTQTYGVDYEETFSPVAHIKAIRILIAIATYYDYEIWQIDVKTAFLNGRLNEDVYMVQSVK
ncbi:retrovirus-related pol polyprotein from transposon TNT 1-94 [Tanacetum coccineum]